MTSAQIRTARALARKIILSRLLPDEESNDALIVAESAISGVPIVVSSDSHLLNMDQEKLRSLCFEGGLHSNFSSKPPRLLRAIR